MISDFEIVNYRQFDRAHISRLRRINLFVGKNSAGKSSLLEAFLLFFSQMSYKYLPQIHESRQELWAQGWEDNSPFRHLFSGHKTPGIGEVGMRLCSAGDPRSFSIRVQPYVRDTEASIAGVPRLVKVDDVEELDPDQYELFYVMTRDDGDDMRIARVSSSLQDLRRRYTRSVERLFAHCVYIPTKGLQDRDTATLWDAISLTDAEKYVIDGLRLIEPRVAGLAFVEVGNGYVGSDPDGRGIRIPVVKLAEYPDPVPLKSLGDGISRIFQIILSVVNARDGVLIIDEFENGLHWGVQLEVWKLVFALSKPLNVQVFASTHSRDCIEGYQSAWAEEPEAAAFLRVDRDLEGAKIREYSFDLLQDSLDADVEVR